MLCLAAAAPSHGAAPDPLSSVTLIPRPRKIELTKGEFALTPRTVIRVEADDKAFVATADHLKALLGRPTGWALKVVKAPHHREGSMTAKVAAAVVLRQVPAATDLGDEGYRLAITTGSVVIEAATPAGAFYGCQTLRQLLPREIDSPRVAPHPAGGWTAPCVRISDQPRYQWRGFMLDCSRHFMDKEFVKLFIDQMASLKLNRFHWHFIDSNGWRMEVKGKPKLTTVGAWRGPAGDRVGGSYTQDEIREVVAYAAARHIEVIPEFEMPGHSDAAMASYPELSCAGTPYKFPKESLPLENLGWFGKLNKSRPFCAGKDAGFAFNDAVFGEALSLFPAKYWHVGGDERPAGVWTSCTLCQARMKTENLKDEHALQNWFMRRISDLLAARGKRTMSWAVSRSDPYKPTDMDDLGHNAIIQNWHDGAAFAARQGWDVVNSQNGHLYLDYPEFPGTGRPSWMPVLTLETVYSFDPTPASLSTTEAAHILGPEGCLWTEFIPQEAVFPQVFPRIMAVAEIAWSPGDGKDAAAFRSRVEAQRERFALRGVRYGCPPEKKRAPGSIWGD